MSNYDFGKATVHHVGSIPDRLQLIAKQVDQSVQDPWTHATASEIVRGLPSHGQQSEDLEVSSVFWFVKNNVRYQQDPRDYDYYQTAKRAIQHGAGDCDCASVTVASLLSTLGYQTGAKVISPDGQSWHIYAWAGVNSRENPRNWIALDTTQPGSYPGWEPGALHQRYIYMCKFKDGKAEIVKEK